MRQSKTFKSLLVTTIATFCNTTLLACSFLIMIKGTSYVALFYILGARQLKDTYATNEEIDQHDLTAKLCPTDCYAENCGDPKCEQCEFACGGTCAYMEEWETNAPPKPADPPSTICPITTFDDITSQKFTDNFWYKTQNIGRPFRPETAPLFIDLNGDGILDFHTMSHQRVLAESVKTDCHRSETGNCYELKNVVERIQYSNRKQGDSHGSVIMDLDGDGILDLLVSNGGALGGTKDDDVSVTENSLLWGDLDDNGNIVFQGGREAARAAGVSMPKARGRFNFILDANGDGLLDIFFATDRPKVNALFPGFLFINQGDRTFRKDDMVSEYSTSMLMTDVDGDGFANEFVITRDLCYPQTKGPYSDESMEYCRTRPLGTTAVYKFNPNTNQMEDIGKHYSNATPTKEKQPPCCAPGTIGTFNSNNMNCYVRSTASADLDGDLLADQVFLYSTKLVFYFSSDRPKGTLPFGGQYIGTEIFLPLYCTGKVLRIVDLDNDGKEEIIIGCFEGATFLVYTKGATKRDWTLENNCNDGYALGDITDLSLAAPNQDDYEKFCESSNRVSKDYCTSYQNKIPNQPIETITDVKLAGTSIVDLNNDGFQDIVVSNVKGHIRFFQNRPSVDKKMNLFIAIKLVGKGVGTGNVYGIGATVILFSKDCEGCEEQMREVSSYQHATDKWGYQDDRIYFGLGANGKPVKAVVFWPNGSVQTKELCGWEFSSYVVPVTIEQCDKGANDQCGDSAIPCEEEDADQGAAHDTPPPPPQHNDKTSETCEDSDSKFQLKKSNPLSCRYVNKVTNLRESRCSKITKYGKPVSDFCRKSCGICQ